MMSAKAEIMHQDTCFSEELRNTHELVFVNEPSKTKKPLLIHVEVLYFDTCISVYIGICAGIYIGICAEE